MGTEAAWRASGEAGRISEGIGASWEGIGASWEGLGARWEGLGASWEGLGASQEGLGPWEMKKERKSIPKVTVPYGTAALKKKRGPVDWSKNLSLMKHVM